MLQKERQPTLKRGTVKAAPKFNNVTD